MVIQKSPDTKEEVLPEETKPRGKRTHKPTTCPDKRRAYLTCGICGSENVVSHGVVYCKICGEEAPFLILGEDWIFNFEIDKIEYPKCKCQTKNKYDTKYARISVKECLDCGAVCGPRCPVCKRQLWAKDKKRFCKGYCGYRI